MPLSLISTMYCAVKHAGLATKLGAIVFAAAETYSEISVCLLTFLSYSAVCTASALNVNFCASISRVACLSRPQHRLPFLLQHFLWTPERLENSWIFSAAELSQRILHLLEITRFVGLLDLTC